eukprot:m.61575 g.61575  ORF g.61575 m.61575 type:complete len:101 (+) comp13890_c0_seq1:1255-1557(+)
MNGHTKCIKIQFTCQTPHHTPVAPSTSYSSAIPTSIRSIRVNTALANWTCVVIFEPLVSTLYMKEMQAWQSPTPITCLKLFHTDNAVAFSSFAQALYLRC